MSTFRNYITFTKPQRDFLRAESEHLGIPVAELVRRAIDQYRLDSNRRSDGDAATR